MRKPLFVTLATGATLLVGGGVAVAMAGEPVSNSQAAVARQTAEPTDEPSITPTAQPSVSPSASPSLSPGKTTISRAQAQAIALRRVGGGHIESTELEWEDGRLVWDVDVIRQGVKWEVEIDSRSGLVVEFKADGDRRDDHGDRRGDDHGDRHGDHHGDNSGPGDGDDDGDHEDNSGPGSGGDDGDHGDSSGPGDGD